MKNKVTAYAGYWEPLAHYRRGGALSRAENDEAYHQSFYTQETVEKLQALAVSCIIWPGYKGLGMKFERPEWEMLKPFRKLVEKAGIEFGVYFQCGSFWAETMYAENPQAKNWTAIDNYGQPHSYSDFYRCYWRHRPCLTQETFSQYVGRIAGILVKEYGATFFYADNNAQMPCYTPHFKKAFHEFLKQKYKTNTPAGLKRFTQRYGYPFVDQIYLPCGSQRRPIDAMAGLNEPGIQDWVEFRCRLVARNAQIISAAAKAQNPKARLCYNMSYDYGDFHQLVWGVEPEFMAETADYIMSEDPNHPRVESNGRLISHMHTCKHLRALGKTGHFHAPTAHGDMRKGNSILSLMEMATLNQGILGPIYEFGAFDVNEGDVRPPTIRFIHKHEDIFANNDPISEIAVLRSRHSSTVTWLEATQGRLMAQQGLYQAGFQWDNFVDETPLKQLEKYALLILPETICVPDDCVKRIADYVRGGGRVLAVGEALARDGWGRRRSNAPVGSPPGEREDSFASTGESGYAAAILAAWMKLEDKYADRLYAFPRLQSPHPYIWEVDETRVPVLDHKYHTLPLNNARFIDGVHEALGRPPMVEIAASQRSPYVIPMLLRSHRTQAASLHVLNYDVEKRVESLTLRLRLPDRVKASGAQFISLETDRPQPIRLTQSKGTITLTLPSFQVYAGVIF